MRKLSEQIRYWQASAERNLKAALDLYENKHLDSSLFFCHLALEKLLKALLIQHTKKPAPYLHDLAKLASLAKIPLDETHLEDLRIITTFNIAARYDEVKFQFYKKCTPTFTKKYLEITKHLFQWLKKESHKK